MNASAEEFVPDTVLTHRVFERHRLPDLDVLLMAADQALVTPTTAILARGVALRIELPGGLAALARPASTSERRPTSRTTRHATPAPPPLEVLQALAARSPSATEAVAPLALGALPYDPNRPAHLIVPRQTLVLRADSAELLTLGHHPADPDLSMPLRRLPAAPSPGAYRVAADPSADAYLDAVTAALRAIESGRLDKVVLARRVRIDADRPWPVASIHARLARDLAGMAARVGPLLAASPELLLSRHGSAVVSRPLAGTSAGSGPDVAAQLAASPKDHDEHRFVVDHVCQALATHTRQLDVDTPRPLGLGRLTHLATTVSAVVEADRPGSDALSLLAALHPTPAVGGTPTAEARALQRELECGDRGLYAGAVGWLDAAGDGEWWLSIRSATIEATRATLWAGAGIVAGSEPEAELAETSLKLAPMLDALVRP